MMAKIVCGIIMFVMIAGIIFLTFQAPEQTTALSERVRLWLNDLGWEMTPQHIRSNVHIPIFFLLGIAVFTFGHIMKWKWYVTFFLAIGIALIDEGIKLFLPTREFDWIDLLKDYLGIGIALVSCFFFWNKKGFFAEMQLNKENGSLMTLFRLF